jgi:hypothetical protein
MAYSKITIDFVAVQQGTILSFTETNLNIFCETFKKTGLVLNSKAIPVNSST